MKNILIILSIVAIVVLSVLGGKEPSVPSSVKIGDSSKTPFETAHFPD